MEQVLYRNEVMLDDDRVMKLEYGLIEKISDEDQKSHYYGISVTKQLEGNEETEKIDGVSLSKDIVISMIKKLCRFEVTPISMIEIVDELITEGI